MLSSLLPIAAEEGGVDGTQVVLPPWGEIFYAALILLIIVLVVGKYALPRIYAMLDAREKQITDGLSAADRAREDQAQAAREREEILRAANTQAQEIRSQANEEAAHIVARAQQDAQDEARRIAETAQRQIEAERQAAQISLRTDVGLLAAELAERIVGEQLRDTALTARVVDRFLDELEHDGASASVEADHR
jgi:F-type H+-transporting ATPase subunit b